jgi:hypothetical protein
MGKMPRRTTDVRLRTAHFREEKHMRFSPIMAWYKHEIVNSKLYYVNRGFRVPVFRTSGQEPAMHTRLRDSTV